MGADRKFEWRDGRFVNRVSGEPIPDDEPVILFRARDRHAFDVLRFYLTLATDPHHRAAIRERMGEFADYEHRYPERMKEPGITHDMRLLSDDATAIEMAFRAAYDEAVSDMRNGTGSVETAWARYDHHKDHSVTSTAFGPADHPALPLGLRRHPRWALRLEVSRTMPAQHDLEAFDYHDLVTVYAHKSDDLIEVAAAVNVQPQAATFHALEEWTGTMWEDRPLTLLVQPLS